MNKLAILILEDIQENVGGDIIRIFDCLYKEDYVNGGFCVEIRDYNMWLWMHAVYGDNHKNEFFKIFDIKEPNSIQTVIKLIKER